jgi:hypothetical protein
VTPAQLAALLYAAALHLAGIAAVTALLITGHIDQNTGVGILGALIGFAVGVPVTVTTATAGGRLYAMERRLDRLERPPTPTAPTA